MTTCQNDSDIMWCSCPIKWHVSYPPRAGAGKKAPFVRVLAHAVRQAGPNTAQEPHEMAQGVRQEDVASLLRGVK